MKRLTKIYLEAARRLAEGDMAISVAACVAVHAVCDGIDSREAWIEKGLSDVVPQARSAFASMFEPTLEERHDGDEKGPFLCTVWLQRCDELARDPAVTNRRVMALCFAAAMAETGDLS